MPMLFMQARASAWIFDLSTDAWSSVSASDSPEQLVYATLIYVPDLRGTVLFGGVSVDSESLRRESWLFDAVGQSWRMLSIGVTPSARAWHSAAWDSDTKRLWKFGG